MATKYTWQVVVTGSGLSEQRTDYTRPTIAVARRQLLFRQWREDGYHQKRGEPTLFRKGKNHWRRAEIEQVENE